MDHLILVDSVLPMPENYSVDLININGIMLERQTGESCERMLCSAEKDGISIKLISGYRSVDYQQMLWNRSVAEHMSEGLNKSDAEKLTLRYLAKPHHSEHHTGLACDFCTFLQDDVCDDFHLTEEGRWLCKNAHKFGFILRYPRMKEHITGIAYEPWHYRFVGEEHSVIITRQGLTLEEYLYYYKENP